MTVSPIADTENWSETTIGLCPTCLRDVPALLFAENERIWICQTCPRHGESKALLASDATEYLRLRRYISQRLVGLECCGPGETCGVNPDGTISKPPTCVLLLEITQACNLRCPTCYADSNNDNVHKHMSIDEAKARLDVFFTTQKTLDVLMLSGGEPTIHPQFSEMLDLALSYPIERILINTNGLRIARHDPTLQTIAAHSDRVELYLSFASFRSDVQKRLYGRDLLVEKTDAIERAKSAGIFVTLVPTVERGINEDEIGDLYRFALKHDNINGITFQPVMDNGRYEHDYHAEDRLTLTDILRQLETQTESVLRVSDFVALPCSHPDCCVLTYGLLDNRRTVLTPITRHLDIANYLDLFSDRISFHGLISAAAKRIWGDTINLRAASTLRDLATLFAHGGMVDILPLVGNKKAMGRRIFRVVVKPFMDAQTYDRNRIEQCCTKIVNERGEAVSFCEYNIFHRGRTTIAKTGLKPLMMAKV